MSSIGYSNASPRASRLTHSLRLVLVGLLALPIGCSPATSPEISTPQPSQTKVVVRVDGAPPDTQTMRAQLTLNGRKAQPIEFKGPDFTKLGFALPAGSRGALEIELDTFPTFPFASATAQGKTTETLTSDEAIAQVSLTQIESCLSHGWCWQNPLPQGNAYLALWAFSASSVWAGGLRGLFHQWDGSLWAPVPMSPVSSTSLYGIWASSPSDVWVSSGPDNILSHWNGTSWESFNSGGIGQRRIWGSGPNDVWAIARSGNIAQWNGTKWTTKNIGVSDDLFGIYGNGPMDIWIVGDPGRALHWTGNSFSPPITAGQVLHAVWTSGPGGDVWVVGRSGYIGKYDNINAFVSHNCTSNDLYDIKGNSTQDIWTVGDSGTVCHWDGSAWTVISSGVLDSLVSIAIAAPNDIWIGGGGGTLLHWDGSAIHRVLGGEPTYKDIWGASEKDLWAVGIRGALSHFDGTQWKTSTIQTTDDLQSIAGTSQSDIWIGGAKEAWHWNGSAWTRSADAPNDITGLWGAAPDKYWAVTANGQVFFHNGKVWSMQDAGLSTGDKARISATSATNVWVAVGNLSSTAMQVSAWDGTNWTQHNVTVGRNPTDVVLQAFANDDVWLNIGEDLFYHWDGSSWKSASTTSGVGGRKTMWGANGQSIWSAGTYFVLDEYNGTKWINLDNATTGHSNPGNGGLLTVNKIWGLSAQQIWAVGTDGMILRYRGN